MDASVNSSNSSIIPLSIPCSKSNAYIFMSWLIVYILFLPVFIFVLYIGYQRWRNLSMAVTHSDVFTFHVVVLELMNIVASCLYCWYLFTGTILGTVGTVIIIMVSFGEMGYHVLTCGEHYLAVTHPITYQGLKQMGGVRIRNICIGCVWLFAFGLTITIHVVGIYDHIILISEFLIVFLCEVFISYCSFSVLCVLIRPGPGEVGGNRKIINKSKRRALNTMMTILSALSLKLICHLMLCIANLVVEYMTDVSCAILMCSLWFNLPSSLVVPLLFLHRAGKRPGKQN